MKFQNPLFNFKQQRAITQKMQRAITRKPLLLLFFNFHQVIYSLSSISCPSLKLLAVMVFKISSFPCPNLQSTITQKTRNVTNT